MDWQSVQPLFNWLSENPAWAGLFVFLIALSESLLIVGLIVPGTVLMFGVGTLVGTGVLDMKSTMFIAFLGAVAGDGISFWIGKHYREQLSLLWPFNKKPEYLENGQKFFQKHGGKSILFGRFVGPVRPIIPAVAGMMGMSGKSFAVVNVVSAAGWAPFYLIPGIVFGTSIGLASVVGTRLVLIIVGLFVITILLFWVTRKLMLFAIPRADNYFQKVYRWTSKHPIAGEYVLAIIDPKTSERRGLAVFSLLGVVGLSLFSFTIAKLAHKDLFGLDSFSANIMSVLSSEFADMFFVLIQEFTSWQVIIFALLNIIVLLYAFDHKQALRHLLLIIVLSVSSLLMIDWVLNISGSLQSRILLLKLVIATSAFSQAGIILLYSFSLVQRWLVYSTILLLVIMLSLVLLYFGHVKFSALIISLSLSMFWIVLIGLAYRRHAEPIKQRVLITVTTAVMLVLTSTMTARIHFENSLHVLKDKTELHIIAKEDWLNKTWKELAVYRSDVFGYHKQFLNVQWHAELQEVETFLVSQGWQKPAVFDLTHVLYWLKPGVNIDEIARLPQTHRGIKEKLVLMKTIPESAEPLVLQLWPSNYTIGESGKSVWTGSVTQQSIQTKMGWLPQLTVGDDYDIAINLFKSELKGWSTINMSLSQANNNQLLLIAE